MQIGWIAVSTNFGRSADAHRGSMERRVTGGVVRP